MNSVESTPLATSKLKQQSGGGSSCESGSPQSPSSPPQSPQPEPFLQELSTAASSTPVCKPELKKRNPGKALESEKWSQHSRFSRCGSFITSKIDASDYLLSSLQSSSSPLQKPQPQRFLQKNAARPTVVFSISLAADAASGARLVHTQQHNRHAKEKYADRQNKCTPSCIHDNRWQREHDMKRESNKNAGFILVVMIIAVVIFRIVTNI